MSWRELPPQEARERWDGSLKAFPEHSVFQSFHWGKYKEALGWSARHWISDGAGAQVLLKTFPGAAVGWCRGGPCGPIEALNDEFRHAVSAGRRLYLRISSELPFSPAAAARMAELGWKRPSAPLSTGKTILIDLEPPEEKLQAGLSRNWRHNLSRSQARGLKIGLWAAPKAAEMAELYGSMQEYKGIGEQHSREDLEALLRELGPQIVCMRCEDENGRLIAFRACAAQEGKAWDLLAATGPEGRKCYASYGLLWALLLECKKLGVKRYDMSGIDPEKAKGVYDFKKGTGGAEAELLGEWDWASPGWLRRPANWLIGRRLAA